MLRLTWYGDDFTGASDTLATVAAAGWRTLLFTRVPSAAQLAAAGALDALGVAGTARALAPAAMREEIAPVAAWFATLGAPVTHYKCCSTFDSAPAVGNLVVGARALGTAAHQPWLPVLGGQPSLGRFCAFGNLYASATAGGEVHRIDRHPTMSRHPVTPMHEADLRRHLAAQGLAPIGHVDLRRLDGDDDAGLDGGLDTALALDASPHAAPDAALHAAPHSAPGAPLSGTFNRAVLFDTTRDEHLARIGRLLWQRAQRRPLLALGASSVAQALMAAWIDERRREGRAGAPPLQALPAASPVFVLAGSLSPVSAAQVAHVVHVAQGGRFDLVTLDVPALMAGGAGFDALVATCVQRLRGGRHVLARTSAPAPAASSPAALDVARACGRLLQRVLAEAPQVRRIGVAGGDTSSFALRTLDPWGLAWAGALTPNLALLRLRADDCALDGLELILKGGQIGPPDVFERLLDGAAAGSPGA